MTPNKRAANLIIFRKYCQLPANITTYKFINCRYFSFLHVIFTCINVLPLLEVKLNVYQFLKKPATYKICLVWIDKDVSRNIFRDVPSIILADLFSFLNIHVRFYGFYTLIRQVRVIKKNCLTCARKSFLFVSFETMIPDHVLEAWYLSCPWDNRITIVEFQALIIQF